MSAIDAISPFLIYLYFYISYAALFFSIPLAIFAFFVFTTQSKNLGVYKYLVMNHTFWCLTFEICFCSIKPLILVPAFGGYQLGIFNGFGTFKSSLLAGAVVSLLLGYMILGVCLTLVQRYVLTVRPSWHSKFKKKYVLPAIILMYVTGFCCILAFFIPILQLDENTILDWINQDYNEFLALFKAQKTFVYVTYDVYRYPILGSLACLGVAFLGGITITIYFMTKVLTLDSIPKNGLQYSLMATSLVQLILICVFLLAPTIWFIASLAFQIPNSANILTFLLSVISLHGIVEFSATLYFVNPYRRYILRLFGKEKHKTFVVSSFSPPMRSQRITVF